MDLWTRQQAITFFGKRIYPIEKMTILVNDPPQFIDHYYHFAAELWLGMWRMIGGHLDPKIGPRGETSVEDPVRIIFAHCATDSGVTRLDTTNIFYTRLSPQ